MKKFLFLSFLILACTSTNACAWWFFFFPIPSGGSGRSGGDICVASSAKVGDTSRSANGNVVTIKELSGTSSRCKKPELPVLAKVEFTASEFSSKAGINLPDGYTPQSLTDIQKFNGALLMAKNNATDSGIFITSAKRDVISDVPTFAAKVRENQTKTLDDAEQSDIEQLTINGMKAWRFETNGKVKNLFGTRYTYLITILEGDSEVVSINAWTRTNRYEIEKADMKQLASNVTGLTAPAPQEEKVPLSAADTVHMQPVSTTPSASPTPATATPTSTTSAPAHSASAAD